MTTMKDLRDWLRESVRDGYLFGCHDEPLDAAGKRIVCAIIDRLEAPAASSGAAPPKCRDCGGETVWISPSWVTCPSCVTRSRDELFRALKVGSHSRAMERIAELTSASSGAAPQEWQPIETLDPECLDVILRPHRVWGAMDVCRMTEAQKGQLTGVLSRGIDWRWMNGDHTTAWSEDASLPFWMPRPPVPAAPPERHTPAAPQEPVDLMGALRRALPKE